MALGARRTRVIGSILAEGLRLLVAGVSVGVVAALAVATLLPAVRASRTDPQEALRAE